jgi:hypothetical protein
MTIMNTRMTSLDTSEGRSREVSVNQYDRPPTMASDCDSNDFT